MVYRYVRRRRKTVCIGILILGCAYFLFSIVCVVFGHCYGGDIEDISNLDSKARLEHLEQELDLKKNELNKIGMVVRNLVMSRDGNQMYQNQNFPMVKGSIKFNSRHNTSIWRNKNILQSTCTLLPHHTVDSDINMIEIYNKLPFDNLPGGEWTQGFPIATSDEEWKEKRLKVIIVPHSHNDPGWLHTVDEYFYGSTLHILNNIVDALSENPHRRFIWAEMSYLSMWWNFATPDRKIKMKKLVKNGQLEMVTAGWVMNDEANTHYFSMIDQMIEGNEWLSRNLQVVPKNGWAIDPFGHSSTMAYVLKKMNFENMLIQRVHYAIKKHLAEQQSLEFRWKQAWSADQSTEILCHMMPFAAYSISYTCGPDPKICCMFDFQRLLPGKRSCPGSQPKPINDKNVAAKSALLLDQYRKKSKLFKTNTLLVILGDDFRYHSMKETLAHFENYEKIINYVNSQPDMNAELRFGTLNEYFQAMKDEIGDVQKFPTLTGDFFTYADTDDDYWSGYYVSRPFHKMQDRVLGSYLRGAEILFSLALPVAKSSVMRRKFSSKLYPLLVEARQNLGLFQHHDGITGTARDHVVIDYGNKLMKSIVDLQKVQAMSAEVLLFRRLSTFDLDVVMFDFDEIYRNQNEAPQRTVITVPTDGSSVVLVVYNSLAYKRTAITLPDDEILPSQTDLIWKDEKNCVEGKYQVQFLATVPPTGLTTFRIKFYSNNKKNTFSTTSNYNNVNGKLNVEDSPFQVSFSSRKLPLLLENHRIEARFSPTNGLLRHVADKITGTSTKVAINFVKYASYGGAYLFRPYGRAKFHVSPNQRQTFRVITGPLSSEIQVVLPYLLHRVILFHGNGDGTQPLGVHVRNDIDVSNGYLNEEIAMRITSDVQSSDKFYTDLNGFQIQQRTNYDKLPLQANFYPMPSMAFIQDRYKRLTLLTGQPLGVSSLKEGQLEVIMDRRLRTGDSRGLGQGVRDNVMTPESFVILLEHWMVEKRETSLSYPSLAAHRMSWELLHPFRTMTLKSDFNKQSKSVLTEFDSFPSRSWPCDIHLLNLRSIQSRDRVEPTDQSALILHRIGRECGLDSDQLFNHHCQDNDQNANYDVSIISQHHLSSIRTMSLSLQHDGVKLDADSKLNIKPMEIEAFKVTLS